jgi:hypothetical protein
MSDKPHFREIYDAILGHGWLTVTEICTLANKDRREVNRIINGASYQGRVFDRRDITEAEVIERGLTHRTNAVFCAIVEEGFTVKVARALVVEAAALLSPGFIPHEQPLQAFSDALDDLIKAATAGRD